MLIRIFATVASDCTNTIIIGPASVHEEASWLGARYARLRRFIFSRRGVSKTATWEHLKIRYATAPCTSCATATTARLYLPVVSCRTLQPPGDVNDNRSLFPTSFYTYTDEIHANVYNQGSLIARMGPKTIPEVRR